MARTKDIQLRAIYEKFNKIRDIKKEISSDYFIDKKIILKESA